MKKHLTTPVFVVVAGMTLWGAMLIAKPSSAPASRPPIEGVAQVTLRVSNMAQSVAFFNRVLGFQEAFALPHSRRVYFKVNDLQYLVLEPGLKGARGHRLAAVAFRTTNARGLCAYMIAHGVRIRRAVHRDGARNLRFGLTDPNGHRVEFIQYVKGSLTSRHDGQDMPATRISQEIIHFGFIVDHPNAADRLYKNTLGFYETWHGGMTDTVTDWVDMRVPNGVNWLEYMLHNHNPSLRIRGIMDHFSLGVPSAEAVYKEVLARGYHPPEAPKIGRDGKWQLNLYDPDGTRVEVMEFKPVQAPCCSPMILPSGRVLAPAPSGSSK